METLRVDVCYRPLRIAWAIAAGDFDAFRRAVQYSYALWGGCFNPIIVVDHDEEARQIIDLFRVDFIMPLSASEDVQSFPKKYPHLVNPFFKEAIFKKSEDGDHGDHQVLDIHNALVYLRDNPEWAAIKTSGLRLFTWQPNDPLADVLLAQLGGYPSADEVGTDYRAWLSAALGASDSALDPVAPIPAISPRDSGISYLARHGLAHHHSVSPGRTTPGFFVGRASNLDDLVCYWNLRACDIPLWFVDPLHIGRYITLIPAWDKAIRDMVAGYRHEWDRYVGVWTRQEDVDEACKLFGGVPLSRCQISDATWNGLNIRAPTMHFGQESVLGVMGSSHGTPKLSFALPEKPFCDDIWFHQQRLVASVSVVAGLYGDEQHTLRLPFLPELNESLSRAMCFRRDTLRVEPDRFGVLIGAADRDVSVAALSVADLVTRVFGMAGYEARLSSAGLITRQLIARLGGLQGARVFKIPGVRRLLRMHGPRDSFTKCVALQAIGSPDPSRPGAKFSDHEDLYIEPRPRGEKLRACDVFGYLVEKGLLRLGVELACPACRLKSWTQLDRLKQPLACELCGQEHDATRQLSSYDKWDYRRSGVLGIEKHSQGAVPVSLTLQQLGASFMHSSMYSPSLELMPTEGTAGTACEVDFVWIMPRTVPEKTVVILGECKDQGQLSANDIENLKRVADALPASRFDAFVALSKLAPFSDAEIALASTINGDGQCRAILLTERELEPYFIYERSRAELGHYGYGSSPEDMARVTAMLYFK
jgi:hypothetical protein